MLPILTASPLGMGIRTFESASEFFDDDSRLHTSFPEASANLPTTNETSLITMARNQRLAWSTGCLPNLSAPRVVRASRHKHHRDYALCQPGRLLGCCDGRSTKGRPSSRLPRNDEPYGPGEFENAVACARILCGWSRSSNRVVTRLKARGTEKRGIVPMLWTTIRRTALDSIVPQGATTQLGTGLEVPTTAISVVTSVSLELITRHHMV
jgi:hypothetical protein